MAAKNYLKALGICLCFYAFAAKACLPVISWNDSISFCQGNSIQLSAFNTNSSYVWSTGASTPTLNINSTGTYWVQVTNACGTTSDTIHVHVDQPLWFSLGPDTSMCSNGNNILQAPASSSAFYLWSDGSRSSSIQVTSSGTYWVSVTNSCGVFTDTIYIDYTAFPQVNLGPDINSCTSASQLLQAQTPLTGQRLWSTGDTTSSITVNQPGSYWLQVTNRCGTSSDTIDVSYRQGVALDIGDTVHRCPSSFVVLKPNFSGGTYQWSTGAVTPSITVGNQGAYWLQYTDQCGTYYDTAYVLTSGKAQVNLGSDTTVCVNKAYVLNAGNYGSSHSWQDGSTKSSFRVTQTGTYWVAVDNGCGNAYDTVHITLSLQPNPPIADTVFFCAGGSVSVDAGNFGPYTYYNWSNNFSGRSQSFNSTGNHWVEVGNECDTVIKNFRVQSMIPTQVSLGPDVIKCGNSHRLTPSLPKSRNSFVWSNGSKRNTLNVSSGGTYWVQATNACGVSYDTVSVTLQSPADMLSRKNEKICIGGTLLLRGKAVPGTSYQWSNGGSAPNTFVTQPGTYYYTATNLCGTVTDTVQVTTDYPLQVNLGPDTAFCEPGVLDIDLSTLPADSLRWSTGSAASSIQITSSGTYWVKAYNACGMFTDTIDVVVGLLPRKRVGNKGFCTGGSVVLRANQSHVHTYQWNTGDTLPSITVNQAGWYWVTMTSNCGTVIDSAYVREEFPIPQFSLGNDTIFCKGNLVLRPPVQPGYRYMWQDGRRKSTYNVTRSGYYKVTVSNSCNAVTDSILVVITGAPRFALGNQVRFCYGTTLFLNAQNPGSTYLWSTGATSQVLAIDSGGVYSVQITNNCGTLVDTVEVIVEYPLDKVELGNDTTICFGQQVVLDAYHRNEDILWSDGSTDSTLTVTQTGTYWVRLRNSCGRWYDTVHVEVLEIPVFDLGNDTAFCLLGGSVELQGPPDLWKYSWSNGDTSASTVTSTPGMHWLSVQNQCFSYTDSIFVKGEMPINIDLGPDTALCFGEVYSIDTEIKDYQVQWSDGATGRAKNITSTGTYWARASNTCGVYTDSVKVSFDRPISEEPIDTVLCEGDSASYDLSFYEHQILWQDGSEEPERSFKKEGIYPFTVINKCGEYHKEVIIVTNNCECPVYIANAFTPNADGTNDQFRPIFDCAVLGYRFEIFDRWGMRVFLSHNLDEHWDGGLAGKPLPMGIYTFRLYYSFEVYGKLVEREERGSISLIR